MAARAEIECSHNAINHYCEKNKQAKQNNSPFLKTPFAKKNVCPSTIHLSVCPATSLCAWGACWGQGQGRVNWRGALSRLDAPLFNRMLFSNRCLHLSVYPATSLCAWGGCWREGQGRANQRRTQSKLDAPLFSIGCSSRIGAYVCLCVHLRVCVRGWAVGGRVRGGSTRAGRRANWMRPSSIGCSSRIGAYICLCVQLRVCVRG